MSESWIEWIEPFGPNNEPVYCRVTTTTAIAVQKHIASKLPRAFQYSSDEGALEDFMMVHWASFTGAP